MKKRYIYSILFGLPGLLAALIASFFIVGATAGFIWLYVFGDDAWPRSASIVLSLLFIIAFVVIWSTFITIGYKTGSKLETEPRLNKRHVLASIGITLSIILSIFLYQLNTGHIGKKHDSIICADFCRSSGFMASSLTPQNAGERICSCLNSKGQKAINIPLKDIPSE